MKNLRFLYVLSILTVASCVNQQSREKPENEPVSLSVIDSLNKKVNEGHELAMAKMGTIVRLQKSALTMVDSLQKSDPDNQVLINEIQKANHDLESIKGSMYVWMENFDFDLKNMDSVQKVNYLKVHLKRILEIDDSTTQIINDAKSTMRLR